MLDFASMGRDMHCTDKSMLMLVTFHTVPNADRFKE
jgi:hypothetical protein